MLKDVAESVIKWAKDGLERRGIGESMYLNELVEDVITGVTPAEKLAQMYNEKWGKNVDPVFEELHYYVELDSHDKMPFFCVSGRF